MTISQENKQILLIDQLCIPCRAGTPMPLQEAERLLSSLTNWQMTDDGTWLEKRLSFANFAEALAYVNRVASIAEAENHHPDIRFGWGYVTLRLQTHAVGGLHRNDFILAAKIDAV
jgi:4a-hydroxytetrahydrobiopterin dehydratase